MAATLQTEALGCPHCGVGIALAIAADENGTNYNCGNCGHGFTRPASKDKMSSPPLVPDTIAGTRTAGNPGAGSVLPDGSNAGRQVPSVHADAGPGTQPQPVAKPTPTSGGQGTPRTHDELDALAAEQATPDYPADGSVAEKQAAIEAAS